MIRSIRTSAFLVLEAIELGRGVYSFMYKLGSWSLQFLLWMTFVSLIIWKFDFEWSPLSPSLWAIFALWFWVIGSIGKVLVRLIEWTRSSSSSREFSTSWKNSSWKNIIFGCFVVPAICAISFGILFAFERIVLLFGAPFSKEIIQKVLDSQ